MAEQSKHQAQADTPRAMDDSANLEVLADELLLTTLRRRCESEPDDEPDDGQMITSLVEAHLARRRRRVA